jgi:hypothetical protein
MTRFIHGQFAKQYLTELLTPYGQVETSKDITTEVRQIDVLFIPSFTPMYRKSRNPRNTGKNGDKLCYT